MSTRLAAHHFQRAFFQWLVDDEVNGNVSDSVEMAINRRAEMNVGINRDWSGSLTGSGMKFAILTIQEVKMEISPKSQQRRASTCHGRAREGGKGVVRHVQRSGAS